MNPQDKPVDALTVADKYGYIPYQTAIYVMEAFTLAVIVVVVYFIVKANKKKG